MNWTLLAAHAKLSRCLSFFYYFMQPTIAIVISILISLYNKKKLLLFSLTTYFYIKTALSLYQLENSCYFTSVHDIWKNEFARDTRRDKRNIIEKRCIGNKNSLELKKIEEAARTRVLNRKAARNDIAMLRDRARLEFRIERYALRGRENGNLANRMV